MPEESNKKTWKLWYAFLHVTSLFDLVENHLLQKLNRIPWELLQEQDQGSTFAKEEREFVTLCTLLALVGAHAEALGHKL